MAVITISRQFGTGGITLGKLCAKKLGYRFFDETLLKKVAQKAKVSPNWVEMVEKEAGGLFQKFFQQLTPKSLVDQILDEKRGYIDEDIYVELVSEVVSRIAREGNAVILGRGSQYILMDQPDVFHVLLVGEKKDRIKFLQDRYGFKYDYALQRVEKEDKRRINIYKKFDKEDYDNPSLYHLVFNMSRVDLNHASEVLCSLIE